MNGFSLGSGPPELNKTGLTKTGLTKADLTKADLTGTGLTKTGLTKTGLTKTGLTKTGLTKIVAALEYGKSIPALAAILGLLFLAASIQPYRIEGDAAYQIKSAQQYRAGQSPSANVLRFARSSDLSADQDVWISWWPPLPPWLFGGILSLKLPLGPLTRVIIYLLTLAGSIGWLLVARRLPLSRRGRLFALAALIMVAITLHTPYELDTFDVFSFSVQPWLFLAGLSLAGSNLAGSNLARSNLAGLNPAGLNPAAPSFRPENSLSLGQGIAFGLFCLALGCTYWVKFSAVLGAAALLLFVFWQVIRSGFRGWLKLSLLGVGTALFIMPVALLSALNHIYSGPLTILDSHLAVGRQPPLGRVLLYAAGGPGLSLFGVGGTWDGLFFERILPNYHPEHYAIAPISWLGLIGSFLLLAILWWAWRRMDRKIAILACLTVIVPSAAFGYMMLRTGTVYPLIGTRHVLPYWILVEFLAVGMFDDWLRKSHRVPAAILAWLACGYVLVPCAYQAANFVRRTAVEYGSRPYTPTGNRLFVPALSPSNSARIARQIACTVHSPEDVVVMATLTLGMESWLEIPQRMLPLTSFWAPLQRQFGTQGASVGGTSPLVTSRNLRVILVVSNLYYRPDREETIRAVMARFPQARRWIPVQDPSVQAGDAGLWYADLDASATSAHVSLVQNASGKPYEARR